MRCTCAAVDDEDNFAFRRNFMRTYMERDVAQFGVRIPAETPAGRPGKGFHNAREDLQPKRSFVDHSGEDRCPAAEGVEAIGARDLAAMLRDL